MIRIQNKYLKGAAEFLQNNLLLKGKQNIHRMRLVNAMLAYNEKIAEEEITLIKEYAEKNDDGEIIKSESDGVLISDMNAFNQQHKDLLEEYYILNNPNLEEAILTIADSLSNYEESLSGKEAKMHYYLYNVFNGEISGFNEEVASNE